MSMIDPNLITMYVVMKKCYSNTSAPVPAHKPALASQILAERHSYLSFSQHNTQSNA